MQAAPRVARRRFITIALLAGPLCSGCRITPASQPGSTFSASPFQVERLAQNPIIRPEMPGLEGSAGQNINGPAVIRVPDWINQPLGRYYLYFAHHSGKYIRLAYADRPEGPWTVYKPGVLALDQAPGHGHIASPDVHVDDARHEIRMYFHQPQGKGTRVAGIGQASYVATSPDGLHFKARPEVLGHFYFRVFQHAGWYYAFAKAENEDGVLYRSPDGLTGFVEGPHFLPGVRHTAIWCRGDTLYLFYSKAGDRPERILVSTIDLRQDWRQWRPTGESVVVEPTTDYEGANLPLEPSTYGASDKPARQLRDPYVLEDKGQFYLFYSVAGERGIAVARMWIQ